MATMAFCTGCGTQASSDTIFCPQCGARLKVRGIEVEVFGNNASDVQSVLESVAGKLSNNQSSTRREQNIENEEPISGRMEILKEALPQLYEDLCALESLLRLDTPSSLNKIRFITEKVLHNICTNKNVSWGQGEPTLERMIGPLLTAGYIPKNIAIYVRTIQTTASPGSHYQESALSGSHVSIAVSALMAFLEWCSEAA